MKRLRKLAKVVALVAVVLLVFVVVFIWQNSVKRNAAVTPIREAGDPISIAELRPNDVVPESNAATYVLPVSEDLQKLVNDIYPIAFADDYDAKSGLTDKQRQEARELFAAHAKVDEAMLRVSHCETLQWPLEYEAATERFLESLLNYTQTSRALARFHIAKSPMLTADGDADAAANACLQGLRMVRLQSDTPTIVSMMVNNACRITLSDELGGLLMSEEIQPKTHEAIEAELIKHDLLDAFVQTLKSERALGISSFNSFPSVHGRTSKQMQRESKHRE